MRVTLVHNPSSGSGSLEGSDLVAAVHEAGHQATYVSTEDSAAVAERLNDPGDLVVAVGGDGTFRNVATRLIGREIPLTLIPTGTANNIGRTLGITGEARDLIAGWSNAPIVPFDTGIVRGAAGPYPLIEGAGFGPIAVTIAALSSLTKAEASAEWTGDEIRRDVKVLREVLADYPVHECTVHLDGQDLSGEYILIETMNIRSVGPNIDLAPAANVSDGLLDLVLVSDDERTVLRDYLTARIEGEHPVLRLPTWRGRHVQIAWKGSRIHIDDEVWPNERDAANGASWSRDGRIELEILVNPAALQVMRPVQE